MSITLVETPGAADANTYASAAEALTYNAQRPFATAWAALTDDEQAAALIQAALVLDASFVWTGGAVDATQALGWPRTGMATRNGFAIGTTEIPTVLKNAQSELARQLAAADRTADNDALKAGLTSVRAGSVALTFQLPGASSNSIDLRDADVIQAGPEFLWMSRMMPDAVMMLIPPSWYTRDTVSMPILFEAD